MSERRKITWRAFGDDRIQGAAFGWTRYNGSFGELTEAPFGTKNDERRDPLDPRHGPNRVVLHKIRGSSVWRGEFYCAGRTVVVESPIRVPGFEDGYTEAREQAKLRTEERFWREYDAWHDPAAKAAREAEARAKVEEAERERAENERRLRVAAAGEVLGHALRAVLDEVGDKVSDDVAALANAALREAGLLT